MKKLVSLLAAILLMLSIVGCSQPAKPTESNTTSSSTTTTTATNTPTSISTTTTQTTTIKPTTTTTQTTTTTTTQEKTTTTQKSTTTTTVKKPTTTTTKKPTTTTIKTTTTTKAPTTTTTTAHTHTYSDWKITKAATCSAEGVEERVCSCGKIEIQSIAKLGHAVVIDKASAATCEKSGLTEGKHCSTCNTIIVKQEAVAKLSHDYSEEYISGNPSHILFTCKKCGDNYKENVDTIAAEISIGIGTMLINGLRYDTCIYVENIVGGYGTKKVTSSEGYKSFSTDHDFENGTLISKTIDVVYLQSWALSSKTVNITISDSYGNSKTYQVQV